MNQVTSWPQVVMKNQSLIFKKLNQLIDTVNNLITSQQTLINVLENVLKEKELPGSYKTNN